VANPKDIDKMARSFKELAELQQYADAQYSTIITLNKKIYELSQKNEQLEHLLNQSPKQSPITLNDLGIPNEELIAYEQLRALKAHSAVRELSLEESRRVELYSKILTSLRSNTDVVPITRVSKDEKDELLAQLADSDKH